VTQVGLAFFFPGFKRLIYWLKNTNNPRIEPLKHVQLAMVRDALTVFDVSLARMSSTNAVDGGTKSTALYAPYLGFNELPVSLPLSTGGGTGRYSGPRPSNSSDDENDDDDNNFAEGPQERLASSELRLVL